MKDTDQALVKKIQTLYGLRNVQFLRKIRSGYLSHNFVLQSGKEKYFLKQYKYDDLERVEQIHRVQDFFHEGGIPIIHAIIAKNGKEIFEYKKKFFTLLPYVQARLIRRKDRTPEAYFSAGQMLAKIHLLSKNGYPKIVDKRFRHWRKEEFEEQYREILSEITRKKMKSSFDKLALKVIRLKRELANKEKLNFKSFKPTHLIHGDYHGSNIFFDAKNNVSHVFDIEKAEAAPRAYELARSLDFMCFSTHFNEQSFKHGKEYLRGYNSVYPISRKEFIVGLKLNYLIMIYTLWILKEHYVIKSTRADELLDSQYISLKYYSNHFDEFVKKLLG